MFQTGIHVYKIKNYFCYENYKSIPAFQENKISCSKTKFTFFRPWFEINKPFSLFMLMSTKLGCVILLCSVCINYRNSLMYAGQESNYWEGGRAPCKMTGKGSFNSQQFDIKKYF